MYDDTYTGSCRGSVGVEGSGFTLTTSPGKQKAAKMPSVHTILTEKQLTILAVYCLIPKPD